MGFRLFFFTHRQNINAMQFFYETSAFSKRNILMA